MDENPKPRRRWFQISLRTLLLLVTLTGVGFGFVGIKVRQVQRQRHAVAAIRKLGGDVAYDYQKIPCQVPGAFDLSKSPPGPEWFRSIFGEDVFAYVFFVNCWGVPLTDDDLVFLHDLPEVEVIHIPGAKVTDAGMIHFDGLNKLVRFKAGATQITKARSQELEKRLPNLTAYAGDDE